jgi:murein L,D-transpeptidase YafK
MCRSIHRLSTLIVAAQIAVTVLVVACSHETEGAAMGLHADWVLVEKGQRRLSLLSHGVVLKEYPIALGARPIGPKIQEGDRRTPEGRYVIDSSDSHSRFYLALRISYPSEVDRARARSFGVSPGGNIMIHGTADLPRWPPWAARISSYAQFRRWQRVWTLGCIAVQNSVMDEIWQAVSDGTAVEIRP